MRVRLQSRHLDVCVAAAVALCLFFGGAYAQELTDYKGMSADPFTGTCDAFKSHIKHPGIHIPRANPPAKGTQIHQPNAVGITNTQTAISVTLI